MIKYCTKCGNLLDENGKCAQCGTEETKNASQDSIKNIIKKIKCFIHTLLKRMGFVEDGSLNFYENGQKIVPDNVIANEGEVLIKQYDIAKLRSRLLMKSARGRLAVTNKRLIFRASGPSMTGPIAIQHEFSIEEIAGVEIKSSNRISVLSLIVGIILSVFVSSATSDLFSSFQSSNDSAVIALAYIFTIICLVPFFLIKKKFWIKLIFISAAMGAQLRFERLASEAMNVMLGGSLFNFANIISFILTLLLIVCLISIAFVPDLKLCIKTKSAGDAIEISRKVWGFFLKQHDEKTGFSEVLPWKDTNTAIKEIGSLLDDVRTFGDRAVDMWRDK